MDRLKQTPTWPPCSRKACTSGPGGTPGAGTLLPVVLAYADEAMRTRPARGLMSLPHCAACSSTTTAADLVLPASRERLAAQLLKLGKAATVAWVLEWDSPVTPQAMHAVLEALAPKHKPGQG